MQEKANTQRLFKAWYYYQTGFWPTRTKAMEIKWKHSYTTRRYCGLGKLISEKKEKKYYKSGLMFSHYTGRS